MYLANLIDDVLESKKDKLVGRPSYFYICDVLNRAFRKVEPFKFKYETYNEYLSGDYSVSGIYDMDEDVKYIVLNFSKNCKTFNLRPETWRDFKFSISQVCQHESIHQHQWQFRDASDFEKESLDFRNIDGPVDEDQEYLSDPDEIDAYAHDIAMEIKYCYPKKDPYLVLRNINRYKKLWSYNYYKKTFRGEDWSEIKHRLYKKTFRWIPHVTV